MLCTLDIETDGLKPTKIWVVVVKIREAVHVCTTPEQLRNCTGGVSVLVGHNILGYDLPALEKLWDWSFKGKVIDTLILSKYLCSGREEGHSLDSWGQELGFPKGEHSEYSQLSDEMISYCKNDVELSYKLFCYLWKIVSKGDIEALDCEHQVAKICEKMSVDGFAFDIKKATDLRNTLNIEVIRLEEDFQKSFPPTVEQRPRSIKITPYNPASPVQVIDKLWEAEWRPSNKTDGHKKYKGHDKKKKDRFKRYGWKLDETNLSSLPHDCDPVYRNVVRYLLLISRVRRLDEWIGLYNEDTKAIHGRFDNLGTWTHRFIHSAPNMGNVAAEKSIKYKGEELSSIASSLGRKMRELWIIHEDADWLVGTDAEGIQLRVFAHYINDPVFTAALITGNKEQGTDVHSLNQKTLGRGTRDTAKTFIYAFLLHAGDRKLAEILGCGLEEARELISRFVKAYPGIEILKKEVIPRDAKRGYFIGLDGRRVSCDSEHLMLAGYLQNGEATVMKHANIKWRKDLEKSQIWFRQVNLIHDEFQTETRGSKEEAQAVGRVQEASIEWAGNTLNCRCPLSGKATVGKNWYENH